MNSKLPFAGRRYVVISPVRDEAEHLSGVIQSMLEQTVRPVRWILVNDGSVDQTPDIVSRIASQESWITAVHLPQRQTREPGTAVIKAFYEGYKCIQASDWDFLVKLDADLSFAPDYFEKCLAEFEADPKLGVGGGIICHQTNGQLRPERHPRFHVRGATKIYRRACWEHIAGLVEAPGWDTIDEVKANMLGWSTRSFPHLRLVHHRFTGAAAGPWRNAMKNGLAAYITGYHPAFMAAKCARRLLQKPYFIGSLGLACGFLSGYLRGVPLRAEKSLIRYVRSQQLRRLFFSTSIWR